MLTNMSENSSFPLENTHSLWVVWGKFQKQFHGKIKIWGKICEITTLCTVNKELIKELISRIFIAEREFLDFPHCDHQLANIIDFQDYFLWDRGFFSHNMYEN